MQADRRKKNDLSSITGVIMNTLKLSQNVRFNWNMSVGYAILGGMNELWNKYTYVCGSCDALVESTTKLSNFFQDPVCSCAENSLTLLSVVDATIGNSTTEKDNPIMETTTTVPATYNPNALVTYKKIAGTYASPEAPEYITDKVVDLEWRLQQGRNHSEEITKYVRKIENLEGVLHTYCQEATDPDMSFIEEIADIFDIRLTKEVSFSGTINFSGTVTVDLTEDFDLDDLIQSNITVDAYNGDIEISDYSVENVSEDY